MAGLSSITFNVGEGGLGRRTPNQDKISALLFYNNTLPTGFAADDREKKVYTLGQAEALGIIEGSVNHAVEWYHISEYFRINPEGELWIGFYPVPALTYDYAEITTLATAAAGEIRLMGVYNGNDEAFATAEVTKMQTLVDALDALGYNLSIIYAGDFSAVADWLAVGDLRALAARKVSVCVAQDGGGAGAALYASKAYSITAIGAQLGAHSRSAVQQSIGNPANFNMSDGTELETIALANGDAANDLTILASLKDDGYSVMRKYLPEISGSYFERIPTSIPATSDFAFIENNRVIDKAIRLTRTVMTPEIQKDLLLNADGTLTDDVTGYFSDIVGTKLEAMVANGEISNYNVLIDPAQDVLATDTVVVTIQILPLGIAEFITVNIGLVTSL